MLTNWTFERIDERTIRVACPTFTTELDLTLNSVDRKILAFYALVSDLMADRDALRYRHWRAHAERLCHELRFESPEWIDGYLDADIHNPAEPVSLSRAESAAFWSKWHARETGRRGG
ncbi:MAG: hypothetical protein YHS30scaffold667_55 [Phage 65_10]|nr:MAG: hypothetical protein YHS30scaffold667_55 [Phage 65_10]